MDKNAEKNHGDNNFVIFHFRRYRKTLKGVELDAKGGATVVYHRLTNSFGVALCQPTDRYVKAEGVKHAKQNRQKNPYKYATIHNDAKLEILREAATVAVIRAMNDYNATVRSRAEKAYSEVASLALPSYGNPNSEYNNGNYSICHYQKQG